MIHRPPVSAKGPPSPDFTDRAGDSGRRHSRPRRAPWPPLPSTGCLWKSPYPAGDTVAQPHYRRRPLAAASRTWISLETPSIADSRRLSRISPGPPRSSVAAGVSVWLFFSPIRRRVVIWFCRRFRLPPFARSSSVARQRGMWDRKLDGAPPQ